MRHAHAEGRLRAMHEDIDVTTREAERIGDILTGAFLEESQRDDGALHAAQRRDAQAEAHDVLGVREQVLGVDVAGRRRLVVERLMRERAAVEAAVIARGVADDRLRGRERVLVLLEAQEGHEGVLHALERFLGVEALGARDPDEGAALTSEIG
jgi:hypothetical protein